MIRNNDSSLVERLDGIRKKRHKHICLNDNLHVRAVLCVVAQSLLTNANLKQHDDPETPRVKRIVLDFYNSLLPERCSFELDPQPLRTEYLALWR